MVRFVLPAAVFGAILLFLGLGLKLDPTRVPSPLIGKPVPKFSLPKLEEPAARFSHADLSGNVSLVNVWATWCVSCREEHPILLELARADVVPIFGLNYKDERDAALGWLAQYGNPYAANAFDEDGRTAIDWGVYGAPETFVIDRRGFVRFKHVGPLTAEFVRGELLPLIEKLKREHG
jgi:cytochrome c biogenesis protein CcmG, thiol:disulfide interchange protein DsbE